jgi:hypothetical protein
MPVSIALGLAAGDAGGLAGAAVGEAVAGEEVAAPLLGGATSGFLVQARPLRDTAASKRTVRFQQ